MKRKDIPARYKTGDALPVQNVAELIAQLQELPPDLKIYHGWNEGVKLIVVKYNFTKTRLMFEDAEDA